MYRRKILLTLGTIFMLVLLGGSSVEMSASDTTDHQPGSTVLDGCVTTPGKNKGHCEPTVNGGYACVKAGFFERKDCSR